MAWNTKKNSAVTFALRKLEEALKELSGRGTVDSNNLAEILSDAVDLCKERINNFSAAETKEKIQMTASKLLDLVIVLLRLLRQINEGGITADIKGLMEKSGLVNKLLCCV